MSTKIEDDELFRVLPAPPPETKKLGAIRDARPVGSFTTFGKAPPAWRLEVDDLAFHAGSAVTLPFQRAPDGEKLTLKGDELDWRDDEFVKAYKDSSPERFKEWEAAGQKPPEQLEAPGSLDNTSLSLLAVVYKLLELNSDLKVVVAGHGESSEDDKLADARATNFAALLTGDRDAFAKSCLAFSTPDDYLDIGHLLGRCFGWAFSDEARRDEKVALGEFRRGYNALTKVGDLKSFFPKELPLDGDHATGDDWGGLYDCYMVVLAALVGKKKPDDLKSFRSRVKFLDDDKKSLGFGKQVALPTGTGWRSQAARRVEILFLPSEVTSAAKQRGVAGVYEPGLCELTQIDPKLFIKPVEVLDKREFSESDEVDDDEKLSIDIKLPKKPEGDHYFDALQELPRSWPARCEKDE
jgi:hypothetical protein